MRDQLVVVSIAYQRAPLTIRDRLSHTADFCVACRPLSPAQVSERLILSTCNRLEVYAVAPAATDGADRLIAWLAAAHDLPAQTVRRFATVARQRGAVRHLFRVAAGLESMLLGEPQILSQIRDALDLAREAETVGPILNRLATDALHIGKRARTETGIARNRSSLAHVAIDVAAAELHGLSGRRAVIIGAGQTGRLAARILQGAALADLAIVNRSADRGRDVADSVGARFAPLPALPHELAMADLAIAAATVSRPLVGEAEIRSLDRARRPHPMLAIDLGVPRNIDPAIRAAETIRVIDLEALQPHAEARRHDYAAEIAAAETLVDAAVDGFITWWEGRPATATIAALRQHAEAIRSAELDAALRKLNHLSARDRNVVSALSVALVNKLLHQPTTALREGDCPEVSANIVSDLFGLSQPTNSAQS